MEICHDVLNQTIQQTLAFDEHADYSAWKATLRDRFKELTGLYEIEKNAAKDNEFQIEFEEKKDGYTLTRFTFASEVGTRVPCYLLIPDTGRQTYPVAITLQGHSTGFHNSIGEIKFPEKDTNYQPRGAFALQAVKNGYAALCIEQRGMGERRPTDKPRDAKMCLYTAMTALMLGRTVLGERVWDISRAIDVLAEKFPLCNTEQVLITGNSGGGTASFYAACYEERIKLCVPSCAFCSYKASILDMFHCSCNYIPNAYRYFEMQDLSALIAPRPIAVIAGEKDPIFPIHGVREAYDTLSAIYKKANAADKCRMEVTPREHWWCEDIVWGEILRAAQALGW